MKFIKLLFIGIVMSVSTALIADNTEQKSQETNAEIINQLPATAAGSNDDDCQ